MFGGGVTVTDERYCCVSTFVRVKPPDVFKRRHNSFQERAISKHDVVVMLTTRDLMPRKVKVLTYCEKRTVQTFILVDSVICYFLHLSPKTKASPQLQ